MTDEPKQIDENAVLAQMGAALEAEGMRESQSAFPPGVPMDPCVVASKPEPDAATPDHPTADFLTGQIPAALPYLREVIALAVGSGMTHIRTGNLEMRFDPESRKAGEKTERTSF